MISISTRAYSALTQRGCKVTIDLRGADVGPEWLCWMHDQGIRKRVLLDDCAITRLVAHCTRKSCSWSWILSVLRALLPKPLPKGRPAELRAISDHVVARMRDSEPVGQATLISRLKSYLSATYAVEVARRGGETSISTEDGTEDLRCWNRDKNQRLVLLRANAKRYYSRGAQWWTSLSYLCGVDDSGRWAVRVPGSIEEVSEALDWITPSAVKKAVEKGKRVERQGDVYIVETTKQHDLPSNHRFLSSAEAVACGFEGGRWLLHDEHRPLKLDFPCRFVPQKALGMGRGNGTTQWGAD